MQKQQNKNTSRNNTTQVNNFPPAHKRETFLFIIFLLFIAAWSFHLHGNKTVRVTVKFVAPQVAQASIPPQETLQQQAQEFAQYNTDEKNRIHVRCLAKNVFYEGAGTSYDEKIRIINVTLNRMKDSKYSDDVCGVIMQHAQFSWTLEPKKLHTPIETLYKNNPVALKEWQNDLALAQIALHKDMPDLTQGALYYKRPNVHPKDWNMQKLVMLDVGSTYHHYYKDRN